MVKSSEAMHRLGKNAQEFGEKFKPLGEDIEKVAEHLFPFIKGVGSAATAVLAFGYAVEKGYSALKNFNSEVSNLQTFSESIGSSSAEVKVLEEQLAKYNITAAQSQAILQGAARGQADLTKAASEMEADVVERGRV